jgi:hypothetical protein
VSGDFDPRDLDSRERDDGIHDREDDWLTLGCGPGSAAVRDGDDDVRDRDDDWREERHREPRDRDELDESLLSQVPEVEHVLTLQAREARILHVELDAS